MVPAAGPQETVLFLYGTLRHLPLLRIVAGQDLHPQPAHLPDHAVFRVAGAPYPMIAPAPGQSAPGLLVRLSPRARARLDFYEAGHGYDTRAVRAQTASGPVEARIYWPPADGPGADGPWRLDQWERERADLQCRAARHAMAMMGRQAPGHVARRLPSLLARAQAEVNAAAAAPTTLRHHARPGDVDIVRSVTAYADFFSVEEITLRHRSFSGAMGAPIRRAGFVSADAVTVLPYDPRRDRVLLVEQFRTGPMLRGDPQPWSLEAIAGRIDSGETPQQAARREAREEAGLTLDRLLPLGGHYPSPGAKTEYLYCFLALADLPDSAAGLGGLPEEGEDIRAHVLAFDALMALIDTGEVNNGPLILSALHLARRRDGLRAGDGHDPVT